MKSRRQRFIWGARAVLPGALIGLVEDLILIATLGYYAPSWRLKWLYRATLKEARRRDARPQDDPIHGGP